MALPAPRLKAAPGQTGAHCHRGALRVGVLGAIADPFYFLWWTYQFFQFTRREGFPRARPYWWIFVPVFGFYVLWQQLDDLRKAAETTNSERLNPTLVLGLLVGSLAADRVFVAASDAAVSLTTLAAGAVLLGAALYTTQSAVTSYLAVRYPFEQLRGMTVGETIATLLGILLTALLLFGIFLPA